MTDKEKIKKIIRILNKHVEDVGDLAWKIKKITAKIITDVGGSGEVRRQRRDIKKAVKVMQQKRPFDN